MPHPFPHRYEVTLRGDFGPNATIESPSKPSIAGGAPPEFDGKPENWSPEHLLLASLGLCMQGTFHALATRAALSYGGYTTQMRGTLEKTKEGIVFTEIVVAVSVRVAPGDREKAEKTLQSSKKYCIVSNALKLEPKLEMSISS